MDLGRKEGKGKGGGTNGKGTLELFLFVYIVLELRHHSPKTRADRNHVIIRSRQRQIVSPAASFELLDLDEPVQPSMDRRLTTNNAGKGALEKAKGKEKKAVYSSTLSFFCARKSSY